MRTRLHSRPALDGHDYVGLASGAEARVTNGARDRAVVLVNGGTEAPVEGTWSATLEWLTRRLAPRFPELAFVEVRYRTKSWRELARCIEDAQAAIALSRGRGAERIALLGFSMGGAVAIAAAADVAVERVVALAPWIPRELDVTPVRGRELWWIHGSLDRSLLGVPGVTVESARRGVERVEQAGVTVHRAIIRGGLHGTAVRTRAGRLVPLPRARAWAAHVAGALRGV